MSLAIRNLFQELQAAVNSSSNSSPLGNITETSPSTSSPSNTNTSSLSQGNAPNTFNGKVSWRNISGQELEGHLTNELKKVAGQDLSKYEGKTFFLANRSTKVEAGNNSELKAASGNYSDEGAIVTVVNGQVKLKSQKIFQLSTTADITKSTRFEPKRRAHGVSDKIVAFGSKSSPYRSPGSISFAPIEGWTVSRTDSEGNLVTENVDEKNKSMLLHTGGTNVAGGQGCIIFHPSEQAEIAKLLEGSSGGQFNMLIVDSEDQALNTIA